MLILHIDIDFFVDPVVYYRTDTGPRPSGREFRAEAADAVKYFAEKQCRLSLRSKIPGAAVVHNDEVLTKMEEFIGRGLITAPFELIHVDAHADLGVGNHDRSFERITTDLLHRPQNDRLPHIRSGYGALGFGNWLAFTLACRLVDKLTVVRHPAAKDDLHPAYFSEYLAPDWQKRPTRRDFHVRLQPLTADEHSTGAWRRTGAWGRKLLHPIEAPLIPATIIERAAFQLDRAPDLLFLCQSPGYSPPSADRIFRSLSKYLRAG